MGPSTEGGQSAVRIDDGTRTAATPQPGANSFTEGQAKDRIVEAGYADVTELKLDDKGVWQGKAMKDGKPVAVSLDYQGNIVAK